jgi:hypothetical protein
MAFGILNICVLKQTESEQKEVVFKPCITRMKFKKYFTNFYRQNIQNRYDLSIDGGLICSKSHIRITIPVTPDEEGINYWHNRTGRFIPR